MSARLQHGRLKATITTLLDAGLDLLPHFEMAVIPVLDAAERPAEWPEIRRRLKAEGVRAKTHRGAFLLTPGDLDVIASVGVFRGIDELFLCSDWNEELEPFPGRISSDQHDFNEAAPLGLEEWMIDAGCLLALGDGDGLNFATLDPALAERLRKQFHLVQVQMRAARSSRLAAVTVPGPAGDLEGLLQEHHEGEPPKAVAVVCHPHPLYGGTLNNKVVHRVASVMHQLGAAVLRFNFRGVGKSAGIFDEGEGELEDARAALAFIRARHPDARSWLGGFSFGSWVAARVAAQDDVLECVTLIAPPIRTSSFAVMHHAAVPKLVVQGTSDTICTPDLLAVEFARWAEPKRLILVEGAGHFFDKKLEPLAEAVRTLLEPFATR